MTLPKKLPPGGSIQSGIVEAQPNFTTKPEKSQPAQTRNAQAIIAASRQHADVVVTGDGDIFPVRSFLETRKCRRYPNQTVFFHLYHALGVATARRFDDGTLTTDDAAEVAQWISWCAMADAARARERALAHWWAK